MDENRDKDTGTTIITTHMTFLSVLYKFAFTFYNLFSFLTFNLFSCLISNIDTDGKRWASIYIEPKHLVAFYF